MRAQQLRTNKGREISTGGDDEMKWNVQKAEDDRAIIGLVLAFGIYANGTASSVMALAGYYGEEIYAF